MEVKPYQIHDKLMVSRCEETIRRLPDGGSFLDVGIGDGFLTNRIVESGKFDSVVAVEKYIERPVYWLDFVLSDAENLPFDDDSFDYVGCFEMLEHTDNPQMICDELARVCRSCVYVTVPIKRMQLDPGHKHFWDSDDLKAMMPGLSVIRLPVGEPRRWYWCEWQQ